ncbi:MAG: NADH-quinone oxidoreductase subunit J [Thermofilum sp.]|jgi:NADH-quinone oxidoreductase subunit J|nr:NADH-quinone oxidoreductase subunit J [Thermofilum sp.]
MSLPELSTIYILSAGVIAVAASALAVRVREDFYSAILLGIVGLSIASLITLLGFTYIGIFHALVYVGATVMFVIMGIVFIGRGFASERRMVPPAILAAILAFFSILLLLSSIVSSRSAEASLELNVAELAKAFAENPLAFFYLSLSLIALVLAGISIAKGEVHE